MAIRRAVSSAMSTTRFRTDGGSASGSASSAAASARVCSSAWDKREERLRGQRQHPAAAHLGGGGQLGEVALDVGPGQLLLSAAPHAEAGGLQLVVRYVDRAGEALPGERLRLRRRHRGDRARVLDPGDRGRLGGQRAVELVARRRAERREPHQDPPAEVEVEREPSGSPSSREPLRERPERWRCGRAPEGRQLQLGARLGGGKECDERVVQPLERPGRRQRHAPATAATASCAAGSRRCPRRGGWPRRRRPRRPGRAAALW